tara:strand:- start:44 stop:433 length:390 start_codon:yes stop_codon:yes gene_type:complete
MPSRHLIYQGSRKPDLGEILIEGEAPEPGHKVELVRRRSPWDPERDVVRVIVGSDPARADVLIEAAGIEPEHFRLYLPLQDEGPNDLKVIVDGTVGINGRTVPHTEWYPLEDGDELECGTWIFRFEQEA